MDLQYTEIGLSVTDLKDEVAFFERLGFRALPLKTTNPTPHTLMTDGELLLGIYATEFKAPTVALYCEDLASQVDSLTHEGLTMRPPPGSNGDATCALAESPAGVAVCLHPRTTLDYPDRPDKPFSRIGIFGELAIPVVDFDTEAEFWNSLGFPVMGDVYEQPEKWAILGSKTLPIGLHQTDRFSDHALTFFSPEMGRTLEELKTEGMELEWEGFDEDDRLAHGVVKSPAGYTLYLFTGDLTKW